MDEPQPPSIRLGDSGEVAAALPHLLGFHPAESLVLVSLRGPGGSRVGLTARADLPHPADTAALARALAARVATDDPAAVLLAVVSEAPDDVPGNAAGPALPAFARVPDGIAELPHRDLVHEVVLALDALDVPVREALLVRAGRWWDYDCPHPCCEPGSGTPLPGGASPLAAAAVAGGAVLAADRAALAARIAPPTEVTGVAAMAEACLRAGREHAARLRTAGRPAVAEECDAAVAEAVAACRPGPATASTRLPDARVARVLWALTLSEVRDRALGLALGEDAAAAEVLWTECTRRAPVPLDGPPATLLAVSAWLRGDGAMANIALDRALAADPGASLPRLLAEGLAACLPPAELRALITDTLTTG
ncbi:DUF4192 domain-containing protein [Geodermatophilus sp. URMC 63]